MKRFAIIPLVIAGCTIFSLQDVNAQAKKKPAAKAATNTVANTAKTTRIEPKASKIANIKVDASFKKIKGVAYKIVKDVPGTNAEIGGGLEFHLVAKTDTLVLGDTRAQNMGKPVTAPVTEVTQPGQFQAIFPYLSAGDSAIVYISCDTLLKTVPEDQKKNLPPWLKSGNSVNVFISVASVKTKADMDKEAEAAKAAQEAQAKEAQAKAAQQIETDDKILQDYFAKNNIKPIKTASGLYYKITKEGTGPQVTNGMTVSMNYTGKLLDGTTFDSNVDPEFKHVEPFKFPVGQHRVIAGWDEGVALLKKGTKATFYIISPLAYGPQAAGPKIGPNSVLLFDVEVVDIVTEK